jgi:phosphate transport system substrate-binding protein
MTTSSKVKWFSLIIASLMIIVLMFAGCNNNSTTPTDHTTATTTVTATSTVTTTSIPDLSGNITESGSTTVQPLAEKLAAAFMAAHPKVKVTIQGGGSGVGIKAANDGTVDIGAASRELTKDDPQLNTILLARDGIAIIVNPANPVSGLTKTQVRDIFAGNITNWKEVGGPDKEIHVAAREEGSGTRTAFQEMVMGKDTSGNAINISKTAILQSSSGAILQVVKGDAQAISFDSFGYVDASVKALAIDNVNATAENAKNGTYPIVRPLYFLTKNQPAGLVKEFLDFCRSSEAQQIIGKEGYVTVQ